MSRILLEVNQYLQLVITSISDPLVSYLLCMEYWFCPNSYVEIPLPM